MNLFEREYESKWSVQFEDAFFNSETFDRNRILKQPEYEASGRASKSSYYVLSMTLAVKDAILLYVSLKLLLNHKELL